MEGTLAGMSQQFDYLEDPCDTAVGRNDSKCTPEMKGIQYHWKLFKSMTSWLTSQEATTVI